MIRKAVGILNFWNLHLVLHLSVSLHLKPRQPPSSSAWGFAVGFELAVSITAERGTSAFLRLLIFLLPVLHWNWCFCSCSLADWSAWKLVIFFFFFSGYFQQVIFFFDPTHLTGIQVWVPAFGRWWKYLTRAR